MKTARMSTAWIYFRPAHDSSVVPVAWSRLAHTVWVRSRDRETFDEVMKRSDGGESRDVDSGKIGKALIGGSRTQ